MPCGLTYASSFEFQCGLRFRERKRILGDDTCVSCAMVSGPDGDLHGASTLGLVSGIQLDVRGAGDACIPNKSHCRPPLRPREMSQRRSVQEPGVCLLVVRRRWPMAAEISSLIESLPPLYFRSTGVECATAQKDLVVANVGVLRQMSGDQEVCHTAQFGTLLFFSFSCLLLCLGAHQSRARMLLDPLTTCDWVGSQALQCAQ